MPQTLKRHKARLLTILVIAFALTSHGASALADETCGLTAAQRDLAQTLLINMVKRGHAPGLVVDIRCSGKPWLAFASGMADVARKRLMRTDDLFRVYSMTKPLTSLAVLMLAEDGRLSLDDPLDRYLPEFAATSVYAGGEHMPPRTEPVHRKVSIRDLLRHSVGIGYISPSPDPIHRLYVQRGIDNGSGARIVPADGSPAVSSAAELSRRIADIPLLHQPGTRFTYGNATDVLGHLLEVVSGKPLRALLRERIFDPLGMVDTGFEVPPEKLHRLTAAYSTASQIPGAGKLLRRGTLTTLPAATLVLAEDPTASIFAQRRSIDFGGAGLVSTAADYQAFMRLMIESGKSERRQIVRPESLSSMVSNQLDVKALDESGLTAQGLGFGLGFGVFIDSARTPGAVPRGGYFWGGAASTNFWVDPDRRITGVLMAQVFGGDITPYFVELLDGIYSQPTKLLCSIDVYPNSDGKPY